MDTLESLRRKIESAGELKSVVRSMKAMAAANIGQYQKAVASLGDYYHNITLGLVAYFRSQKIEQKNSKQQPKRNDEKIIGAIVFGSDQGLVGQFNDYLADFVLKSLNSLQGKKEIWATGERIQLRLADAGLDVTKLFPVPGSVEAINPLIGQILINSQERFEKGNVSEVYIFHNQPQAGAGYTPVMERLLPLDEKWKNTFDELKWPTKKLPKVVGNIEATLIALIREYLFVSLFKACAESLASENESRLIAMQRAEKNIGELLDELGHKFHLLRQNSIDEELFDLVSGFEALKKEKIKGVG